MTLNLSLRLHALGPIWLGSVVAVRAGRQNVWAMDPFPTPPDKGKHPSTHTCQHPPTNDLNAATSSPPHPPAHLLSNIPGPTPPPKGLLVHSSRGKTLRPKLNCYTLNLTDGDILQ
jgi:hypothetical protein